jgi:hypothetical protein
MFKKNDLTHVSTSYFADLNNLTIYFENLIINNNQAIIETNENSYKEHILIHMHTRSLHDLVLKSFNTHFHAKIVKQKNDFIEFINTLEQNLNLSNDENKIINIFLKYIGKKAELPFGHSHGKLIDMFEYDILKYDYEIIDSNKNIDIVNCLKNNNVNLKNYFDFMKILSNKVINDKIFINADLVVHSK